MFADYQRYSFGWHGMEAAYVGARGFSLRCPEEALYRGCETCHFYAMFQAFPLFVIFLFGLCRVPTRKLSLPRLNELIDGSSTQRIQQLEGGERRVLSHRKRVLILTQQLRHDAS